MKGNERRQTQFSEVLRSISYNSRCTIVLAIAKLLTPSLYKNLMNPNLLGPAPCRPMITYVKTNLSQNLVGAEVGVYAASNAFSILTNLHLKRLYLVDSYVPYCDGDGTAVYPERKFAQAKAKLKRFSNVKWIKEKSAQAALKIQEPLDFAYIDANHSYNAVKQDIQAFYPLIREGGVLGGHDFVTRYMGVIRAVCEFAVADGLDLFVEQPDWWIIKGGEKTG